MSTVAWHRKGFIVWGICALFYLYEFLIRTVIGTYQAPLMHDLHLTTLQFSLLSTTLFFVIYGCMQIPVGLIVDHVGLKKSMAVAVVFCGLACFGFSTATSYSGALLYRSMMGLGASFGFVCLLIAVHDWMPRQYKAIFIGLSQLVGTLGPMFAAGPLASLSSSEHVSWRLVFLSLGVFAALLATMVLFFVENNKRTAGNSLVLHKPETVLGSLKKLFTSSQPWVIAVLSAMLYFTVEYLSENEGRAFLGLKGVSLDSASYMITVSWIGYAIGCPLLGFLSDMLERRKIILSSSAVIGLVAILGVLYTSSKWELELSFFLLGVSASGQSVGFANIAEQFKDKFVAIGFALNNGMITVVSALIAPSIGFLLDYNSHKGVPLMHNYLSVFNVLVGMAIAAILLSFFWLKETYCKSVTHFTILRR